MSQSMPISAADVIAAYIEAKDRTHLQLLGRVFVEGDCEIEYADKTHLVSLPSSSRGLEQIAQTLATFGGPYENIRTFCLSRPNSNYLPHFRCDFLVGMNARQDGTVRVGVGQYGWHFGSDDDSRVKKLVIALELMFVLPASESVPIMQWLAALPYPWRGNSAEAPPIVAPGRLRLATRPRRIGSEAVSKTIGIVVAAPLAARAACVVVATITLTCRNSRSRFAGPMARATGTNSRSSSSRLPPSGELRLYTPVMLPPGLFLRMNGRFAPEAAVRWALRIPKRAARPLASAPGRHRQD